MKVRNRVIAIVIVAAVILIAVRIRLITNVPMKSEAAETRLQLEAMADQDISAISEEIELKRSVMDSVYYESETEETESETWE